MGKNKFYTRLGIEFKRVTTILEAAGKPALYFFYGKYGTAVARQIAEEAANRGTQMHNYIYDYYNPDEDAEALYDPSKLEGDVELKQAIRNFHAFDRKYKPKLVLAEQTVYYDECSCFEQGFTKKIKDKCKGDCAEKLYRFAGTFDGIFNIGGKNIMLDWKSSTGIWDEYYMQLEAYANGFKSMVKQGNLKDIKIDGYWVVRFSKGAFTRSVTWSKPNKEGKQFAKLSLTDYEPEEFDSVKHIGRYKPNPKVFKGFKGLIDSIAGIENVKEQQKEIKAAIKARKKAAKIKKPTKKRSTKNVKVNETGNS